jgi:hypothetical protein
VTRNDTQEQVWDPFGTLRRVLWISGGQWAGKSTVARLLALRYGLTAYHYDYHDARGHNDRRIARRVKIGQPPADPDPDQTWVNTTPEDMATETLADFPVRFEWALDDLRCLVSGRPIIAEGWGLRPELVAPIIDSPRQMVVMVPTQAFRDLQLVGVLLGALHRVRSCVHQLRRRRCLVRCSSGGSLAGSWGR